MTLIGRMAQLKKSLNPAGQKAFLENPYQKYTGSFLSTPKNNLSNKSPKFIIGENLNKTVEVLPGPRPETLEASRRGDTIKTIQVSDLVGRMAQSAPSKISEAGMASEVLKKETTPVGTQIKVPFTQKQFTVPGDTFGKLTKEITELPEKVAQSINPQYLDKIIKTGKVPEREDKLYKVLTYQEDLQDMIDSGVHPLVAFNLVGAGAIIDVAIVGDAFKALTKQIAKIPVTKASVKKLTWDDLFRIRKGEILSADKMAAFKYGAQRIEGKPAIDWVKAMREQGVTKKGGELVITKQPGKTLGQWIDEQAKAVKASEAGFTKTPKFTGRMAEKEPLDLVGKKLSVEKGAFKGIPVIKPIKPIVKAVESITQQAKKFDNVDDFINKGVKKIDEVKTGEPITIKGYHGTPDGRFLEEFDPNKKGYFKDAPELLADNTDFNQLYGGTGKGFNQETGVYKGISFTDDYNVAKSYMEKPAYDYQNSVPMIVERNITLKNPKVIDASGMKQWEIKLEDIVEQAKKDGYDGVVFKGIKDNYHPDTTISPSNNVVIFNPDQIKTKQQLIDIFNKAKGGKPKEFLATEKPKAELIPKKKTLSGKEQLKEREAIKLEREQAKVEKESFLFSDNETENQYQLFKKLATPKKLDEISDATQLKKKVKADPEKIDNILYSQNKTENEVFDMFKQRRNDELFPLPKVPKETKAVIAEKARQQVKSAKEIVDRRRTIIKATQKQFGISDVELRKITRRDIRLMNNIEFKTFIDDIRKQYEKFAERRQAKNELLQQIKDKNLNIEPLRQAMKLPKIGNMTTNQLIEFDKLLSQYQKDDVFLSKRKLETVSRTELQGVKTYREASEILAMKLGINVEDLGNIKVSEFDRFRGDVALAERNPFYKMMVEETARLQFIRDAEYLEVEENMNKLAGKLGKRFQAIPRQKNIAKWFDAKNKADVEITKAEADVIKLMQDEWIKARDYLINMEAMKKGVNTDNYYTHVRRGILEMVAEDGVVAAVKEVFEAYKLDEQAFNILDSQTGEIMALDKFFKFALRRTGGLKPTQNIVKSFLTYMKIFKKKQALDEIVPLIDIYAHTLTPKETTKTGVLLHGNLIKFVKEWLNTQKGRNVTLLAKQGGKIDLSLRALQNFTYLLDLGLNIPVSVATQIGEQVITYKLLGKKNYIKSKAMALTPKGRRITNKYRNFIGKNPWKELVEPARALGNRLSSGLFIMFQDANVRRTRNFFLGSLTKDEWATETVSPKRLSELRLELGRYGVIPGAKSIYGSTAVGGAYTQYKSWALPILRSEVKNVINLHKLFTKDKAPGKKALLDLYRSLEILALVLIIRNLIGDTKDDSFIGTIKTRAYTEMSTLWQALDPKLFLSSGRITSFLEDIGQNLSTLIKLEEYKVSKFGEYEKGDLKGVKAFEKQFTPRAIRQFQKDKIKTPEDIKKEIRADIKSGKLDVGAAKEKYINEIKKIETASKKKLFELPEDEYKKSLRERIASKEITVEDAKKEFEAYIKSNKEEIQDKLDRKNEDTFISKIVLYAKAMGTDPITAFNRIFTGQKIRRLDNGTIIVERLPLADSQGIKKDRGATGDMILNHTLPLQLGGSNAESNLKLVPRDVWASYTPIENYLGNLLRKEKINKKEAKQLMFDFHDGKITKEEIFNKYN